MQWLITLLVQILLKSTQSLQLSFWITGVCKRIRFQLLVQLSVSQTEKKLESLMRRNYLNSLENFDLQPGKKSFSKDAAHTSLGVFAKKKFIFNEFLFGLTGFLAPMPSSEIIAGVNDVSIFDHSTGPNLMLGGV